MCTENCEQSPTCTCNTLIDRDATMKHAEVLVAIGHGQQVGYFEEGTDKWVDVGYGAIRRFNPLTKPDLLWGVKPREFKTWLTVKKSGGFLGAQTHVKYPSDNVEFTWVGRDVYPKSVRLITPYAN